MWRRSAFLSGVMIVLVVASSVPAGLIGHWKLDEGSGTTVRDSSGKNNNGTLIGGPRWVAGRIGQALSFDGVDDYVQVPHSAALIPTTGKATVSLWINAKRHTGPGGSQWQGIFAKGSWDPRLYNLYTEASEVIHFSTGPATANIGTLSTGKVPLNEWVHVAAVVDGRHLYYINGEPAGESGQGATVPNAGTASLTIGQTGGGDFFLGMIDDVQLYDRALTAEQVKGVFNGVLPVFGKAQNPSPADGATGVAMGLLTWTPAEVAVVENVYLGATPDLTDADRVAANQSIQYKVYYQPSLAWGQKYYWRVDAIDAAGTVYTGNVWSFTASPVKAWAPSPFDGARYVRPNTQLAWSPGSAAISHEVFFGTNRDDVAAGAAGASKGKQPTLTFDPGALENDTNYYWRVDEIDSKGGRETGYVWNFRTLPVIPVSDPNLIGWWKLDEVSGPVVVDASGHDNLGALRGDPQRVPGYDGSALKFNGTNDYVEVPGSAGLIPTTGKATVSVWIDAERHTGPGGSSWQGIFAKGGAPRLYNMYTEASGSIHFSTGPAGAYIGTLSTGKVPLNEWAHVAVVVDGKHLYYINGEPAGEEGQGATVPTGGTAPLTIGKTDEANFFLGMIDDVRLYNVALTQERIREVMRGDPLLAWDARPVNGSIADIRDAESVTWQAGDGADRHDVYFGTDAVAVGDAGTSSPEYRGRQAATSYPLAGLIEFGAGPYFWRIDEVRADGTIRPGRVWSFSVANYFIVDDFEAYTNDSPNRVFQTWIDGYGFSADEFFPDGNQGNGTGGTVGHDIWKEGTPYAMIVETTIVCPGGKRSMPFDYNNIVEPYYSETGRTWTQAQDWTGYDVNTLSLWFYGYPPKFVETAAGLTVHDASWDIWEDASFITPQFDEFRFVYKRLGGDGSIVVKVNSLVNTNGWAKAGVMIRESLAPGCAQADVVVTPSNGVAFQRRLFANDVSKSASQTGVAAPRWVKLTRTGNTLKAEHSADGTTWTSVGTDPAASSDAVTMPGNVYIGLCVTSHDRTRLTTAEFSDITTTGSISGQWQAADIGALLAGNDPDPLYVVVQDSAGRSAVVSHPDGVSAVQRNQWTEWPIPLSQFADVDLKAVRKMTIRVGDRTNPKPGGTGKLFIDDIRVMKPQVQTQATP